jgi:hypothetical protein
MDLNTVGKGQHGKVTLAAKVCSAMRLHLTQPVCCCCVQAGPVIDAGGIFEFARQQGMIKTAA